MDQSIDRKPSYEELELRVEELERAKLELDYARKELTESEERYKALNEASFGGVIIHEDGVIIDCNRSLTEMTGYLREELIGMDGFNLIEPGSLPKVLANIRKGYERPYEVKGMRKDGTSYPLDIRGKNVKYKGRDVRVIEFRDVSYRKKAEKAIKESEEKYKELFEQSPIGLALCTIEGKIVSANPAYASIIGYGPDEVLNLTYWDITPEEYFEAEHEVIKTIKRSRIYGPLDKEYIHKDGHKVSVRLNGMIVKRDGKEYIWSSVEDITALKKAEEEAAKLAEKLQHAHKMEAIGTMAGGIAHDFNNILSAIFGYSEMASGYIPEDSPANECLEQVLNAAKRAKSLVQHILSFSRKESKERVPVQPAIIMKEAINLIRATIPSTIEIEQDISEDSGLILADPTQIHQVIINLCTNSAQAMDSKGGVLKVKVSSVNLTEEFLQFEQVKKPGKYVLIQVSDTGEGIKKENMNRIFDPYFTTKEMGKGTGMGLSVVMGIVKSNEGILKLESTPGVGTVFNIYFAETDQTEIHNRQDVIKDLFGWGKILIVDDEEDLVELTRGRVEKYGYKAVTCISSIDAYRIFKDSPESFDLVISDQTMPGMTGDELALKLFAIREDIPIIICTGYSSKIDYIKAENIGISGFIMKPTTESELLSIISEVLEKKRFQ